MSIQNQKLNLFSYSPKYSNKQKLIFNIINLNNDGTYDIQFEIDKLILKNIEQNDILNGTIYHPNKNYKIINKTKYFYHKIFNIILKYDNLKSFDIENKSIHRLIYYNNWQELITNKFERKQEIWTKEKLLKLSLQCNNRNDFKNKFSAAYHWALRNNMLDEICEHMKIIGNINQNDFLRIVYIYLFPNKTIYIGISKDFNKRHKDRKYYPNDSAQKYINEMNLIPEIKFLSDYIKTEEAQKLERFYIEKYKNDGWNVLNKNSGGSIGGSYKHK